MLTLKDGAKLRDVAKQFVVNHSSVAYFFSVEIVWVNFKDGDEDSKEVELKVTMTEYDQISLERVTDFIKAFVDKEDDGYVYLKYDAEGIKIICDPWTAENIITALRIIKECGDEYDKLGDELDTLRDSCEELNCGLAR